MKVSNLLPKKSPKVVIVAGEESGDKYGAELATALRLAHPSIQLSGIGGHYMADANVRLISNLATIGVTGIVEVIKHLGLIRKTFQLIKKHLKEVEPDLLILIDYPGFNLRLAKVAKQQLSIPVLYFISPQIWAWRGKRLNTIKQNIDHMAVIFPFEKKIYQKAKVPVSFVGHPLVNKINLLLNDTQTITQARRKFGLPLNKHLTACLPGSRKNEIEKHLPTLIEAFQFFKAHDKQLHFVIPIAKNLTGALFESYFHQNNLQNVTLIEGSAQEIVACSDSAVVASGTASFECALLQKPMCIIYKSSWLTYLIAQRLLYVNYLGLCNLLENKMIVPELLQDDFNSYELIKMIWQLAYNEAYRNNMVSKLQKVHQSLSNDEADISLLDLVKSKLCLSTEQKEQNIS